MPQVEIKTSSVPQLQQWKQLYRQRIVHPLDGMWECFVELGEQYEITSDSAFAGYCVVNAERKLLQFFALDEADASQLFREAKNQLGFSGAFVSTCEPLYLSLCMDHQSAVTVNARMYHLPNEFVAADRKVESDTKIRLLTSDELRMAVDFAHEALGADRDWLNGYFTERIERNELFGWSVDDQLIGTGECRISDSQPPYADVGMVVAQTHRGRGIATSILRQLVDRCQSQGLLAICSTEQSNIAAQKSIARAGFISHHRILEITFGETDS